MVWVVFAQGFEEIEAITILDVLRRANIEVKSIGLDHLKVTGSHGLTVTVEEVLENVALDSSVDMIVLPGGMPGTNNLLKSQGLHDVLKSALDNKIFLAAICAAPLVLYKIGALDNQSYTCYPGFEKEISGGIFNSGPVVRSNSIITGRSAGAAIKFSLELVKALRGEEVMKLIEGQLIV